MSFADGFKSHVQAAADAARQFQGFDAMAAQDEYIHSPDLRVTRSKNKSTSTAANTRTHALNSLVSFSESTTTTPDTSFHTATTKDDIGQAISATSTPARARPAHANTADVFGTPLSRSNHPDDSDDDEEEHADDPILHMIRKTPTDSGDSAELKRETLGEEGSVPQQESNEAAQKKKNANRFMEELDMRLSKPISDDVEAGPLEIENEYSSDQPSVKEAFRGWVQSARQSFTFGAKVDTTNGQGTVQLKPLFTRTPLNLPSKDDPTDEEHITLVSSSVLGAEEQAELNQIRNRVSFSDVATALIHIIQHNPRFAFIVFTFILGYGMYFYSTRHGEQDDVT